VLRDGRAVADGKLAGTEMKLIINPRWSRRRDLDELFPHVPPRLASRFLVLDEGVCAEDGQPREPGAQARRDSWHCGLVGAGRTTLLRALFGLGPVVSGRICIKAFEGGYATPGTRIAQGAGFLSEDRKGEGLALDRSIEDNVTLSSLERHARHGWLRLNERRTEVDKMAEAAFCERHWPDAKRLGTLGGNQQKVALGAGSFTSRPTSCAG